MVELRFCSGARGACHLRLPIGGAAKRILKNMSVLDCCEDYQTVAYPWNTLSLAVALLYPS